MKCIHLASVCCLSLQLAHAQGPDYSNFYPWFHQASQVSALYSSNATLRIFNNGAKVMSQPSWKSTVLTTLPMAAAVTNIAYPEGIIPQGTRKGYSDMWFKVRINVSGKSCTGYVWGGDIAKGWRQIDLDGDASTREWVMLGLSTAPRAALTDIRAELRILRGETVIARQEIAGLCLFEECATSPLLRVQTVAKYPHLKMIEASTMFEGCETGIERAFFFWDGERLQLAYHAEFTTQTVFKQQQLFFHDTRSGNTLSCRFSHIDAGFNPVWVWTEHPVAIAAAAK